MENQDFQKILSLCNRCGKCVPVCPSYQVFRKEAFSPRGRLFLLSQNIFFESLEYCLFCEKCGNICPNEISFPEVYLEFLKNKKEEKLCEEIGKIFFQNPLLTFLKINNWLHFINLERKNLSFEKISDKKKGEVIIYYSCGLKYLYPKALEKFIKILKKYEIIPEIPEDIPCCGAVFLNLGILSLVKENALKILKVFNKNQKPIIVFCATCLWMFKKIYPRIFKNTVYEKDFISLSKRTISASTYFFENEKLRDEAENFRNKVSKNKKIVLHFPCHLTEDFNLVKNRIKIKDFCCGSPKINLWLVSFQEKNKKNWFKFLENVDILATFCTGCYLNFNALLRRPPLIYHWFELL